MQWEDDLRVLECSTAVYTFGILNLIWGQAHANRYNHTQIKTTAANWKRRWELEGIREPEADEAKL